MGKRRRRRCSSSSGGSGEGGDEARGEGGIISRFQTIEGGNELETNEWEVPGASPRGGDRRGDVRRGAREQGCAAGGGRHGERRGDQGHRAPGDPRRSVRGLRVGGD